MQLNTNILRAQELLELGKKQIFAYEESDALGVIAGIAIVQKAAEFLKAEYIEEATDIGRSILEYDRKTSGSFKQSGISYSIAETVNYDFIGKPQKYHDEDSTAYRKNYAEREAYKEAAKACTKAMTGCKAKFISNHPDIQPEEINYTLNVQFAETAKCLGLELPEPKKETVVVKLNEL